MPPGGCRAAGLGGAILTIWWAAGPWPLRAQTTVGLAEVPRPIQNAAGLRLLVATDPTYAAALTPTSLTSLQAQGGAEVEPALVAHAWWPDALRLRRYDDAAKDPNADATVTIDDVLAIAERVASQRES